MFPPEYRHCFEFFRKVSPLLLSAVLSIAIADLFRARIFGRFQVCDRLSFVSPHFWLHLSPATVFRQALHHDRTASVGHFSQDTRVCWSPLSTTHHNSISAPRRRHSIEQPLGSIVTVKTQTSSRPSGLYVRMTRGVSIAIALNLVSASGTARARSFYMHERTRTTESAVFEHSHHKSIGGRLLLLPQAARDGPVL